MRLLQDNLFQALWLAWGIYWFASSRWASPTKRRQTSAARRLHLVVHDFEPGWDTYVERPGYGLSADLTFDQVNVNDYQAVLLLGGRAPEYLRNHARLLDLIREFDAQNKWLFSICHGVQILAAAGLTKGKRLTCYEHVRFEAEQAGGIFLNQQAVRDGRLITAQTWQSHPDFYREIFAALSSPLSSPLSP